MIVGFFRNVRAYVQLAVRIASLNLILYGKLNVNDDDKYEKRRRVKRK